MQQIKLFKDTPDVFQENQNPYHIQEAYQSPKKKYFQQTQTIEPWEENTETNPFINVKPKLQKKTSSPKIKRQSSLNLTKQWNSLEKAQPNRESKKLPVLDVGEFNSIKKSIYATKIRSKLDMNSPALRKSQSKQSTTKQTTLPSVQRQLSVQRKIFLMKNISNHQNSTTSSPTKSSRLRKLVNDIKG